VLRGAPLPVATRIGLWVGVQLVVAGLMIASGAVPAGQALNAAGGVVDRLRRGRRPWHAWCAHLVDTSTE
jgi:hypothetical protein